MPYEKPPLHVSSFVQVALSLNHLCCGCVVHDPCAARERHDTTLHGGVEDWTGDITGRGTYSYDRKVNLSTGASVPAGGPCTRGGTRMT